MNISSTKKGIIRKPLFLSKFTFFLKSGTFTGSMSKSNNCTHSKTEWVQLSNCISFCVSYLIAPDIQFVYKGMVPATKTIAGTVNQKIFKLSD